MSTPEFPDAASLLTTPDHGVDIVAVGEPTHDEPAHQLLRNALVRTLVEHGARSVAYETDAVRALGIDDAVRGDDPGTGAVPTDLFSHGFGDLAANQELVAWLRTHNATRPPADRVSFHGFDPPLETMSAPSPRHYLADLHGYLERTLGADALPRRWRDLDRRLGDDGRWASAAAVLDAAESPGATDDAVALRAATDDLLTLLRAQTPALVAASSAEAWHRADLQARAARGLLRYHARAARPAPQEERVGALLGVRDALMAENLLAIRARERDRGPTVVLAHNRHLQRMASTWPLAGMSLRWWSAGAIVAALLGERYVLVAGSIGGGERLPAPAPDTFEGVLERVTGGTPALLAADRVRAALPDDVRVRDDAGPQQGYFPLDHETLDDCDAVLHGSGPEGPAPVGLEELTARIAALPDVTVTIADEASGAPEAAWGNRFFFAGADRRMPFATIVDTDVPGWDEASRLERPGVHRLNVQLGRQEFERRFGIPPARLEQLRNGIDFSRLDVLLPHPLYGVQGWGCILNPTPRSLPMIDELLRQAHARAARRESRGKARSN
jgi:erythromycin esterase-like protein